MKRKNLIIILIILIAILALVIGFKIKKEKDNSKNENTTRDFMLQDEVPSKVNTHGENAGIFVGMTEGEHDNYLFISIKINKKVSKEEQVKSLIFSLSEATGYKIDINSVKVDGNNVKIDLAKTSAPFELTESYNRTDAQKYFISSGANVEKTLLDSINRTIKSYFGGNTKVYLSADSENIDINELHIDSSKDYNEQ